MGRSPAQFIGELIISYFGLSLFVAGIAFLGPFSRITVVAFVVFYFVGVPAVIVGVYKHWVGHMELLKAGTLFATSIYAVLLVFMGADLILGVAVPYPLMVVASLGAALVLIYDCVAVRKIITT